MADHFHVLDSTEISASDVSVADDLSIGDDASVGDDVTLAAGSVLTWGADTNVYRGAANTLATDDNFLVQGSGKAYRFRHSGGNLDLEGTGAKLFVSVFAGTAFDGAQRTYMVLENGAQVLQLVANVEFRATGDGTLRHKVDATATTGGVVFNEDGQATDLRVEGDTDANLLMCKGSTDRVGIGVAAPAAKLDVAGSVLLSTVGAGIKVAEGANATLGRAVLVGGTVTVATTAVTASSEILVTSQVDGGTPGWLRISARTPSTSFVITSSSGTDTSTVAWLIIEPA